MAPILLESINPAINLVNTRKQMGCHAPLIINFLVQENDYSRASAMMCFKSTVHTNTVQLTGNVTGTRTTRHQSTRETRKGAGMLRGIASKTKIT